MSLISLELELFGDRNYEIEDTKKYLTPLYPHTYMHTHTHHTHIWVTIVVKAAQHICIKKYKQYSKNV